MAKRQGPSPPVTGRYTDPAALSQEPGLTQPRLAASEALAARPRRKYPDTTSRSRKLSSQRNHGVGVALVQSRTNRWLTPKAANYLRALERMTQPSTYRRSNPGVNVDSDLRQKLQEARLALLSQLIEEFGVARHSGPRPNITYNDMRAAMRDICPLWPFCK
jgi:hypothetical protein